MATTGESRTSIQEVGGAGDLVVRGADELALHGDRTPREWVKENLFSTWYNGIVTVVFGAIGVALIVLAARFVLVTAQWLPVRANLELFMIGQFSRGERTRIVVELLMLSGAGGMLVGWLRQRARREAELADLEFETTRLRELVGSYWAIAAFVAFCMIVGVRTLNPWLLLLGCVIAGLAGFGVTIRTRRGPTGVALALVPLVPLALAGGVLSQVQDLDNAAAYLIAGVCVVLLALVQYVGRPEVTLSVGLVLGAASFQVLSGTDGLAWIYITCACMPAVFAYINDNDDRLPVAVGWIGAAVFAAGGLLLVNMAGIGVIPLAALGISVTGFTAASRGDAAPGVRLGCFAIIGVATWQLGRLIDVEGIVWDSWGLHTNLIVAATSIILAFPIGVLLALGRRSSLPVLRLLSTVYIEIIRGVPLITLLFIAQLFLSFFFTTRSTLPIVTRATIVVTMFSAAYIAEIVRGGLQSVEKGQTEAGQAMGMSPGAIMRLLVLPQALKAVIPALVGQFISLFKDTSLLFFITVLEFLGVREIIHAQAEFRALGIAETLVFVAFGFWAFSFTMSRESQRLERRLDVGSR